MRILCSAIFVEISHHRFSLSPEENLYSDEVFVRAQLDSFPASSFNVVRAAEEDSPESLSEQKVCSNNVRACSRRSHAQFPSRSSYAEDVLARGLSFSQPLRVRLSLINTPVLYSPTIFQCVGAPETTLTADEQGSTGNWRVSLATTAATRLGLSSSRRRGR